MLLKLIDTSESPFFYGEVGDSLFIAKIKDKSGNVVGAGENVTFNINGVFYTRVTNETGYVNFRISLFPEEYINYYNV